MLLHLPSLVLMVSMTVIPETDTEDYMRIMLYVQMEGMFANYLFGTIGLTSETLASLVATQLVRENPRAVMILDQDHLDIVNSVSLIMEHTISVRQDHSLVLIPMSELFALVVSNF